MAKEEKESISQAAREIKQALFISQGEQDLENHFLVLRAIDDLIHRINDTSNKDLIEDLSPHLEAHRRYLKKILSNKSAKQCSLIHQQKMRDPEKRVVFEEEQRKIREEMLKDVSEEDKKLVEDMFKKLDALKEDEE